MGVEAAKSSRIRRNPLRRRGHPIATTRVSSRCKGNRCLLDRSTFRLLFASGIHWLSPGPPILAVPTSLEVVHVVVSAHGLFGFFHHRLYGVSPNGISITGIPVLRQPVPGIDKCAGVSD